MKRFFLLAAAASLLAGCASYEAFPLNSSFAATCFLKEEREGLTVMARALTQEDCWKYLDRDVMICGYQPVQLLVQNNSKKNYFFSMSRVSLPSVPVQEVADKVHTWTATRATIYGVGALVLFPLIIPAIIDGIGSANANQALDRDFAIKTASDQPITPFSYMNKIFFVPEEAYQPRFQIALLDDETKEVLFFDVNVN